MDFEFVDPLSNDGGTDSLIDVIKVERNPLLVEVDVGYIGEMSSLNNFLNLTANSLQHITDEPLNGPVITKLDPFDVESQIDEENSSMEPNDYDVDNIGSAELEEYIKQETFEYNENAVIGETVLYTCEQCTRTFSGPNELKIHIEVQHGNRLECPNCKKRMKHRRSLVRHMKTMHPEEKSLSNIEHDQMIQGSSHDSSELNCNLCEESKIYSNLAAIRRHIKFEHLHQNSFFCSICEMKFNYQHNLRTHIKRCHNLNPEPQKSSPVRNIIKLDHILRSQKPGTSSLPEEKSKTIKPKSTKHIDRPSKDDSQINSCATSQHECNLCEPPKNFVKKTDWALHILCKHSDKKLFGCPICLKRFKTSGILTRHMRQQHYKRDGVFGCIKCNFKCSNQLDWNKHMIEHEVEQSRFICLYCSEAFPDVGELEVHEIVTHKCRYCDFKSKTDINVNLNHFCDGSEAARNHTRQKNGEIGVLGCIESQLQEHIAIHETKIEEELSNCFTCVYCSERFSDKTQLEEHEILLHKCKHCSFRSKTNIDFDFSHFCIGKNPHSGPQYECNLCAPSRFYQSRKCFRIHMESNHYPSVQIKCTHCQIVLKSSHTQINRHMHRHYITDGLFKCFHCDFESKSKAELNIHRLRCTKGVSRDAPITEYYENVRFICYLCGNDTAFKEFISLRNHFRDSHCGINGRFICSICSKCFRTKQSVEIHEENHIRQQPVWCTECKKVFKSEKTLKSHIDLMHGIKNERKFKCPHCDLTFKTNLCVKRHMIIHSDERPLFQCKFCEKKFKDKRYRIEHERSHTGERPYHCQYCGKTFLLRQTLREHVKIHTDKDSHSCSFCAKKFTKKCHRDAHIQIHTGEWKFECNQCSRKFARSGDFNRHMKNHEKFIL